MNDDIKLPPLPTYIYGRECSPNERVYPAEQLRQAVLAERERCARICEIHDAFGLGVKLCAAAIRSPREDKIAAIRATNDALVAKLREGPL